MENKYLENQADNRKSRIVLFQVEEDCFAVDTYTKQILRVSPSLYQSIIRNDTFDLFFIQKRFETHKKESISLKENIHIITVFLTHSCNIKCSYCYDQFASLKQSCDIEKVKKIILEWKDSKDICVQFFGGEPLLKFKEIIELVEFCEQLKNQKMFSNIYYAITTNGLLLTQEMVSYFNEYHFSVCISADGIFNSFTRHYIGSSEKPFPMEKLTLIQCLNKYYIRITVTPSQILTLSQLADSFFNLGITQIAFSPALDDTLIYSEFDLQHWEQQLYLLAKRIKAGKYTNDFIKNFTIIHQKLQGINICQNYDCNLTAIDVDGEIYPCHRFAALGQEYSMKNWKQSLKRDFRCETCWAGNICTRLCNYDRCILSEEMKDFLCRIYEYEAKLGCWIA